MVKYHIPAHHPLYLSVANCNSTPPDFGQSPDTTERQSFTTPISKSQQVHSDEPKEWVPSSTDTHNRANDTSSPGDICPISYSFRGHDHTVGALHLLAACISLADGLRTFAYDAAFVEFGPSHRKSAPQPNHVHTDVLSSAFPSPTARHLFHHYCNVTSRLLITMGDIGPNPLLTLCTPLTLLDTGSATSAAIRMSILSISTAHFAHDTLNGPTKVVNLADTTWASRCEALGTVSSRLKKAAISNITLATGKSLNAAEGEVLSESSSPI